MFVRVSTTLFSVVAFAGVAAAVPTTLGGRDGSSSCNTGIIQCCSSYQDSSSSFIDDLFTSLGIPSPPADTQVGFTCSPITVGGTSSGSSCTSQPVCCNGNTYNGVIVTGCSPTTINS